MQLNPTQGLRRAAQQYPKRTSTVFGERRRNWTETQNRVSRLAGGLVALGAQPGDRVAILAMNSDRYFETVFAVLWAGCVLVPSNTRWAPAEHAYALQDSSPTFMFVDAAFADVVRRLPGFDAARTVFLGDEPVADMLGYEALIAEHAPIADRSGAGDDLACIMYTGGTTGWPKGVMMSHANMAMAYMSCALISTYDNDVVFLAAAPMFHIAAVTSLLSYTSVGAKIVILPQFDPKAVVEAIVAEQVNTTLLVPTMIDYVDRYLQAKPADMSGLRRLIYGAAPISEALLRRIMVSLPQVQLYQGYGQTEMAGGAVILTPDCHALEGPKAKLLRSAGRAVPGTDFRVVDVMMDEVPRGQVGEIVARGPTVMLGYWRKPEQTEATLVKGWLRTGDAGYMDEDGFLFLVDRVKDMIVSGGENVYSAEVENALAKHPAVLECAVIGVPDEKWGEAVHAVVRLKDGLPADADELTRHCGELIATYKRPRSYSFRTEPLPLSAAGKVLKTELRKPFWAGHERRIA